MDISSRDRDLLTLLTKLETEKYIDVTKMPIEQRIFDDDEKLKKSFPGKTIKRVIMRITIEDEGEKCRSTGGYHFFRLFDENNNYLGRLGYWCPLCYKTMIGPPKMELFHKKGIIELVYRCANCMDEFYKIPIN